MPKSILFTYGSTERLANLLKITQLRSGNTERSGTFTRYTQLIYGSTVRSGNLPSSHSSEV